MQNKENERKKISSFPLKKKDRIFLISVFISGILLFVFVFWLGFPGYFQIGDIFNSLDLVMNNWHPNFIAWILANCYTIFGAHSYYLFLINIFCFYAGLTIFVTALYLYFRSTLFYMFFGVTFIGNIFFHNFIEYHSFAQPMLMWLALSIIFFMLLNPPQTIWVKLFLSICIFVILTFALFWRHNAIVSVYPLFVLFVYLFLERRKTGDKISYLLKFVGLLFGTAVVLIFVVIYQPHLMSRHLSKNIANHIFLLQIVAAVVPENDSSMIPKSWYAKNKTFEDVKKIYEKYPLTADPLDVGWKPWVDNRPFNGGNLPNLKKVWLKALLKYPRNIVKQVMRFINVQWFSEPGWIFNAKQIQYSSNNPWHILVKSRFKENERNISFSPVRAEIYSFLFSHRILINTIYGICFSFILLIVSGFLLIFFPGARSSLLIFCFSVALSACGSSLVFCAFCPSTDNRYMSPILPLAIVGFIGFFTCILAEIKSMRKKNMVVVM